MSGVAVAAGYLDNLKKGRSREQAYLYVGLKKWPEKTYWCLQRENMGKYSSKIHFFAESAENHSQILHKTGFFSSGKNDVRRQQKKLV